MSFDIKLAEKAGVQSKHIARLLGVSRYTANNWLAGRRQPHDLIQGKVDEFMNAVQTAVDAGHLPVEGDGLLPEERSVRLLQILQDLMGTEDNN